MASRIGSLLFIDKPDIEAWVRCFTGLTRTKKLGDNKINGDENEISDVFPATTDCKAIGKISCETFSDMVEELNIN